MIIYIKEQLGTVAPSKQRPQFIYMERWALDELQSHMAKSTTKFTLRVMPNSGDDRRTLGISNSQVILKEWVPEDDT